MVGKMKLGEILLEADLISKEQLQQALADHKKAGMKLGQFLVRQGIVSESDMVNALADQLKLEVYKPSRHAVDPELAKIIPFELANKYQVAPIEIDGQLLKIAMTDPLGIRALDNIEDKTRLEVETLICTEQHLIQLHKCLYGSFSDIGDIIEGIDEVTIGEDSDKAEVKDVDLNMLQGMAEKAPVVVLVNSIIFQAVQEGASDVHISPQKNLVRVRFRVDGKLHEVPSPPKRCFLPIVSRLKILAGMDIAVSRKPQDGRFNVRMKNRDINVRASTIPSIYGENVVLRLLDTSNGIYSLDHLGMSETDQKKLETVTARPHGMILSTGPTGSGKSTSLYAILKTINQPDINIVTIEDPVEYRIDDIMQVQLNSKAGMTFADGLRSILRQDPDVVMVGEIRDLETARVAVQASLTGHRVLSTLHTNDAAGAISRLLDMGVEPFLVSSVIGVSFAQRLVRMVCPACKEPYHPSEEVLKHWNLDENVDGNLMHGKGCMNCMNTGYRGRIGIYEVMMVDEKIQDLILKRSPAHEIKKTAVESGNFTTLRENAIEKVLQGITTLEEVASVVID
ncbi:MAG: general secretion pathway protein GspE [Deltaproteobacteria bacterium SG8_13]|nr:MAG: general secretion pathway protein GspE [Deltaproteobacteria bacterium SG8_13]